ncbi:hypothetical protein BsWGS_01564 [Bradybaena similaris]
MSYPPDRTGEFNSSGVDFFSSQNSSFPAVSYGQQSSGNPQSGNQLAYSLSGDLQHGHNIAQSYQTVMSEGQMASAFMRQNQPHPLSDHFYSFSSPVLYQQKPQPATNQLIQNPPSPCHNQTYSLSMHQSQNSQYASLPGHPQSPQMSPRHFAQHQSPQIMVYNQQSQQIPSSPNQKHQASLLISGSPQSQRLNQSPKQTVSKQQNNPKDRTCDAQFYSNQILQRTDTSINNMHKSSASINTFGHTTQSTHGLQFVHTGGTNSENKVNGDSHLRNIQGSHSGSSMKAQSGNLSKPSGYVSQSSYEHINTSVPSNMQPSRYESILSNSQRIQKASPGRPGVSYMPEITKNRKYGANFILPDYNNISLSNAKPPPNKPSPDPSSGAFTYVQNVHYKLGNPHHTALDNRESEKLISRNSSARSARPVSSGSENLENSSNLMYSNSYALPSIATLVEPTKEISRQNKVSDKSTSTRSITSSGPVPVAQKNTSETVSSVFWFQNQDSLASSFQSDVEAMQADIASYATNKAPIKVSPVPQNTSVHRSTESHVSGQSGLNQAAQVSEVKKAGSVSGVGEQPNAASRPASARGSKADALAAIQIKQELVDSISKYKSGNPNTATTNSSSTKAALQASNAKADTPPSVKDATASVKLLSSNVRDQVENTPSQQQLDFNSARRHSLSETNKARQCVNASPNNFLHSIQKHNNPSGSPAETTAAHYHKHQNMLDQSIQSGQQIAIQIRRNTTPSSLDRSSGDVYKAAYLPDERATVDRYRSPVGKRVAGQNPPSLNSIHQLVEQVQSINAHYPHAQQQQITTTITTNKQGSAHGVEKAGQGHPNPVEVTISGKQPANLSNGTLQQMAPAKNMVVPTGKSDGSSKSISVICYVTLHDYKLICLKSSLETLLLLCQFQVTCFPDRTLQNVNICIDQTFQIKRKVLNHQDTDRVVLFLKKNGFHLGNVLQTITLADARRVYHYLYGITNCTHYSCIKDIFHSEGDHNSDASSVSASSVGKELKKENSLDDINCGQFVPVNPPETNITKKEGSQNAANHNGTKPVSSQISTSLPRSSKDSLTNNQRVTLEKEVDSDDSDDLILVEASEDPHVIRWSENAPKVGNICNTIIGQLRSYVYENERYLVVDDLCRVFGTTDFYDGVEKENIILYSCCQEIAQILNSMHNSFPSLESLHQSLVKEKDIGIHIIDSDYMPGINGFENCKMGSQALKRLLCKQEVVDDDCSSPKQLKLGDSTQVLESDNKQSSTVVQHFLNLHQSEESTKDSSSPGLQAPHINEQQNLNKMVLKVENANRLVQYSETEANSCGDTSQSFMVRKSASQAVHYTSDQTNVSSSPLIAGARNIQDVQGDGVCSSERMANSRRSSRTLKETVGTRHKNQLVSQIIEHEACKDEQQLKSVTDTSGIITDIADAPTSAADIFLIQRSQSCSSESPRLTETVGDTLSSFIDEDNSTGSPLTIKKGEKKRLQHNLYSSTKTVFENISDIQPLNTSVLNSQGSTNIVNNHEQEKVDIINDNLEAPLASCSFEDLIVSNPTSNVVKKRVEKLKSILETRKNKNLPLPRLTLDSRLNLHLLTNNSNSSEDKSCFRDSSVSDLAEEKPSSASFSSECSNNKNERLHGTDCMSNVKSGGHGQGQNNGDISFPERPKSLVATNGSTNNSDRISCNSSSSPEQQIVLPQGKSRQFVDLTSQDAGEAPFAKYFSKSRRALDDSDILFSRNIDPIDILPSQCWKEYSKLFQEHRALQGFVGELQKSIAHMKAEKERSEKITKYYEGVIHDFSTTFKNGDEDTPVVIDDD